MCGRWCWECWYQTCKTFMSVLNLTFYKILFAVGHDKTPTFWTPKFHSDDVNLSIIYVRLPFKGLKNIQGTQSSNKHSFPCNVLALQELFQIFWLKFRVVTFCNYENEKLEQIYILKLCEYWFIYVNIDLRHQYGICEAKPYTCLTKDPQWRGARRGSWLHRQNLITRLQCLLH